MSGQGIIEERGTVTSAEFADLVNRMRIRHIEEIEKRTGKPLDELLDMKEVGLRAHAIAYIVAVSENPDTSWEEAADGRVLKLADDDDEVEPGGPPSRAPGSSRGRKRNG